MISAPFETVDNNEAEHHEAAKCSGLVSCRNTVPNLPVSSTSHRTSLFASRFLAGRSVLDSGQRRIRPSHLNLPIGQERKALRHIELKR
jgi:hypothetical protein